MSEGESRLEVRVVELEVRYAHQERMIEELNGVIIEQQKEISRIHADLRRLADRALQSNEPIHNEPPPHY